ncbi:hypothetical protein AGABI1DRAFT_115858 [Agaricus bisporus var. burnettii JB137-S8]|uniref:Hydrophobin n=1 Tax=Agaricus bisporus var. burnettii (strain JB137-S8 / ATCC MYA-4627 / FGSC 10392) TaxID=597362 RepID=K5XNP3_AGABU|nr:uncharacterized protein AGABI1DRAFT_115858 [Agaricus bisporus var. burnettii JB137-S8]EKM76280.1 hypothetical protein AGABI1DRAFT_115858 [Agaricus bisporus var. burnettii JB137-S8]
MLVSIPRAIFNLVLLLTFAVCASAIATVPVNARRSDPLPADLCPAGNLQCCNALERADDSVVGVLLGLLGIVLQGVEALVGITCSPIDILGIGQNECHTQAVCCENNDFHGIVAIGCVPIIISL